MGQTAAGEVSLQLDSVFLVKNLERTSLQNWYVEPHLYHKPGNAGSLDVWLFTIKEYRELRSRRGEGPEKNLLASALVCVSIPWVYMSATLNSGSLH